MALFLATAMVIWCGLFGWYDFTNGHETLGWFMVAMGWFNSMLMGFNIRGLL